MNPEYLNGDWAHKLPWRLDCQAAQTRTEIENSITRATADISVLTVKAAAPFGGELAARELRTRQTELAYLEARLAALP